MKTITIINWIIYGLLFFAFFVKTTDNKERGKYRRISYILLTFYCLFWSVISFKEVFVYDIMQVFNLKIRVSETIFNALVLILMITKIREDKIFNIFKKDKKDE